MRIELSARSGKKRVVFAFADTHGKHRQAAIPNDVDAVAFAGDACEAGDHEQREDFFAWFSALPAKNGFF
jgi:hypothetical protein